MSKGTASSTSCQHFDLQKKLNSKGFSVPYVLGEDKVFKLKSLHSTVQEVFKILLDEYTKNPHIRISRMAIAARIKCHPNHVSRLLATLVKEGFLYKWQPFGETNITKIEPAITEPSILKKFKYYFKLFAYFSTTMLVARDHVTLLILKDNIYNIRTSTGPRNCTPVELLYLPDRSPWVYNSTEKGVPNTKMTEQEAEQIFGAPKERVSMNFTIEQLEQLAQFPKGSVDYANKMITRDLHSGKSISNVFGYFLSICKSHAAKQTPKTGMTQAQAQGQRDAKMQYQKESEKYQRTSTSFVPGMPVVNHPDNREAMVKVVETENEWFMNVERNVHDRMLNDPSFNQGAAKYANPLWDKVSQDDRDAAMTQIHIACSCRKIVDRSLPMVPTPVIMQETTNWNEMILPHQVSDNDSGFMSTDQAPFSDYGNLEEVY